MSFTLYHGTQKELNRVYTRQGLLDVIDKAQQNYQNKILNPRGSFAGKISRRTDFGFGFYMTDSFDQASRAACKNTNLSAYLYSFKISEEMFSDSSVFEFPEPNLAWLIFVAYNRRTIKHANAPDLCDSIYDAFKDMDFIVGPIADDKCFNVIRRFMEPDPNNDEDTELMHKTVRECIKITPNAKQYLAVSDKVCDYLTEQLRNRDNCIEFDEATRKNINKSTKESKEAWELEVDRILNDKKLNVGYNLPGILDIIKDRNLTWDDLVNQDLTFDDLDAIFNGTQPRTYTFFSPNDIGLS